VSGDRSAEETGGGVPGDDCVGWKQKEGIYQTEAKKTNRGLKGGTKSAISGGT